MPSFKVFNSSRTKTLFSACLFIILGVGLIVTILSSIHTTIFISGDGGIKYMHVSQYASGVYSFDLKLEAVPYIQKLWDEGYFPFHPPFIYEKEGHYYSSFPIFFQLITSFFYKYFGDKGLYILPFIGLMGIWLYVFYLLTKLPIKWYLLTICMLVMIYASPLNIYGAAYWEHTLGIFLTLFGVHYVLFQDKPKTLRFLFGFLSASATFLRSELIAFNFILGSAVLILAFKDRKHIFFLAGLLIPTSFLFVFNYFLTDSLMGVHSWQVTQAVGIYEHLVSLPSNGVKSAYFFIQNSPVFFLLGITLLYINLFVIKENLLFTLIFIGTGIMIILIVPNDGGYQWGPRYLLVLYPQIIILAGLTVEKIKVKKIIKFGFILVFLLSLSWSIYYNSYVGPVRTIRNYKYRVKPLYNYLFESDIELLVLTHSYIANDLTGLFEKKQILCCQWPNDLIVLMNKLYHYNVSDFILVDMVTMSISPDTFEQIENQQQWRLTDKKNISRYRLHYFRKRTK